MSRKRNNTESKAAGRRRARRPVKLSLPSLKTLDLRSRSGQFFLEVRQQIADDIGGLDTLSRAQTELVDRAAGLATRLSAEDALYLSGQPGLDPAAYATLTNALNRVLQTIGLKRVAKDVTSLGSILREEAHG